MEKSHEDIIKRITEVKEKASVRLSFYQSELRKIPIEIFELSGITTLNLGKNHLTMIPMEIEHLNQLSSLHIEDNQLLTLPKEIGKLTNLKCLYLQANRLAKIPSEIGLLSNLTHLYLQGNQLTELPKEIGKLTSLEVLNIDDNQLSSLPREIGDLIHLKELSLKGNQLSELPTGIGSLKKLEYLNLDKNCLATLPGDIGSLINLKKLHLQNNRLSDLPGEIGNMGQLAGLYLQQNRLTGLPEGIGRLSSLKYLHLEENQVEHLPGEIEHLTQLIHLYLDNNQLTELPKGIERLSKLKELNLYNNRLQEIDIKFQNLEDLEDLVLNDNPIKNIPIEIINQGIYAIKNYLKSLEDKARKLKLFEAKLLIVGEGKVGKTCIMNRLLYDRFNPDEVTTEGIEINKWNIKTGKSRNFRVNFWDFGGQEIYHATHQFFLSKRSLYLFVWEARRDEDLVNFDYWLHVIKLLSKESPVIIVLNKIDERIKMIDELSLKSRFKNIIGFHRVSALSGTGIPELRKDIIKAIAHLPHVGDTLPGVWIEIRQILENLDKNYIEYSSYKNICADFGLNEEEANFLSQYFHDLGVFLHFQDSAVLENILFLKPEWATNAVYKLVDTKKIQENCGKFNFNELASIWNNYPEERHIHLVTLMKKFELCFQLSDSLEYIIPELLPANKPGFAWEDRENLQFEYHYDFMPDGIITRFIVRTHDLVKNDIYWKNGVVLKREGTEAMISSEALSRKIRIKIRGKDKKSMLSIIRREIDYIHKTLNYPDVKEMIPCICPECQGSNDPNFYDFSTLKKYVAKNRQEITCDKSIAYVSIDKLFSGIEGLSDETGEVFSLNNAYIDQTREEDIEIKKTINIFLASTGNQEKELQIVKSELLRKSSILRSRGIQLNLRTWDELSTAYDEIKKLYEFSKEVVNSDIFICLIYDRVRPFTIEEFNNAYKNFLNKNKPKIFVFFKKAPIQSMKIMDEFQTVDELKKEIMMYESIYNEYSGIKELVVKIDKKLIELYDFYIQSFGEKHDLGEENEYENDIEDFDIFLAHNNTDKKEVIKLAEQLRTRGLKPWLDIEQIPPGRWFQEVIEGAIHRVKSAAIIIGPGGLGKWQILELNAFISRCLDGDIPVIPVLLPGVATLPSNLLFLKELTWVKFSENIEEKEGLDRLIWGITGQKRL